MTNPHPYKTHQLSGGFCFFTEQIYKQLPGELFAWLLTSNSGFMKNANREIGARGEEFASQYLQNLDYQILSRNWRTKRGELDIVAMRESTLVFCEVKTRTSKVCGLPSDAVSKTKIQHLKTVALEWLNSNQVNRSGIRFDVISVLMEPNSAPQISHIQGIDL